MAEPEERRRSSLGRSARRRAHKAVAAVRCRAARRALGREVPPKAAVTPSEEARLTEEQWALVRPLSPPQRGGVGRRTPNDHRVVLGGEDGFLVAGDARRVRQVGDRLPAS